MQEMRDDRIEECLKEVKAVEDQFRCVKAAFPFSSATRDYLPLLDLRARASQRKPLIENRHLFFRTRREIWIRKVRARRLFPENLFPRGEAICASCSIIDRLCERKHKCIKNIRRHIITMRHIMYSG